MRHTYSSLTLQIYAVLPFCPWYFYKKLEARKKIHMAMRLYFTSWDKNPRPSVNYCSTVQKLLGGSSVHFRSFPETFGETANMPHISKEVGKTFFFLWFSWLQYKIPRFSEAGITLWRDLFKVRNPPVSSMVTIFVIITSGVSQGTRNDSVSKRRNLTQRTCYIADTRAETSNSGWRTLMAVQKLATAICQSLDGRRKDTRWRWCCKRAEKARAWARSAMEDSAEAETAAGRNGPGDAGIMKVIQQWLGSATSTMNRKYPGFFLSPTSQSFTNASRWPRRPRLPGKQNKGVWEL